MIDQIVHFETAKLAYEKKFEENCLCVYDGQKNLGYALDFLGELVFDQKDIEASWENNFESYLAPFQSQLQKWLREKYNIHINVRFEEKGYTVYEKVTEMEKTGWYATYEQALEDGLIEGLNLIK